MNPPSFETPAQAAPPQDKGPRGLRKDLSAAPNGWQKEVLLGFRSGKRDALEAVYRRFAPEIAKLLRLGFVFESRGKKQHFVGYGSPHDLHDALHETFRRAFEPKARQSYDGIRPYGPYLRTIARNLVLGEFRKSEKLFVSLEEHQSSGEGEIENNAESGLLSSPVQTPEQQLEAGQTRDLVAEFLDGLSVEERQLLRLRFVKGLSQRDACDELGMGRQRLRNQEKKLRERMVRFLRSKGEDAWLTQGGELTIFLLGVCGDDLFSVLQFFKSRGSSPILGSEAGEGGLAI